MSKAGVKPVAPSAADPERVAREQRQFKMLLCTCVLIYLLLCAVAPSVGDRCSSLRTAAWWWQGTPQKLKGMWLCFDSYNSEHPYWTLALYTTGYIVFQAFCIPLCGPLSFMAGAMYGFWRGHLAILAGVSVGCSCCFGLAFHLGGGMLRYFKKEQHVDSFKAAVAQRRHQLLRFMLVSRIAPVPNIVVNVVSPVIGVPYPTFILGTMLGQLPYNSVYLLIGNAIANSIGEQSDAAQISAIFDEFMWIKNWVGGLGGLLMVGWLLSMRFKKDPEVGKKDR